MFSPAHNEFLNQHFTISARQNIKNLLTRAGAFPAFQAQKDDLLAKLGIAHPGQGGSFRDQAVGRHAREGVDLQAPGLALAVQNEIRAGIYRETKGLMDTKRKGADKGFLLLRDGCRADLPGALRAALVFGDVIEIVSLGGDDLNGAEGRTVGKPR